MKTQNSLFRFIQFTVLFLIFQAFLVNNAYSIGKGPKYYGQTYHILGNEEVFVRIIKVDGYGKSVNELKNIVNKDINNNFGKKKSHVFDTCWWTFDGYHQTAIIYFYNANKKKLGWLAMNSYFYYNTMGGETGTLDDGDSITKSWSIGSNWKVTLKLKNPKGDDWDDDHFIYMFRSKYQ